MLRCRSERPSPSNRSGGRIRLYCRCRRLPVVGVAVASLFIGGCDRSITGPAPGAEIPPSFSYSEGSVEVIESTFSHSVQGQTETASFADTDWNWYRFEGDYDSQGRLTEFRAYINGAFVGRDNPSWSGMERTGHLTTSSQAYWASSTADHQLIAVGGEVEQIMSSGDSMDCEETMSSGCSKQWWDLGAETVAFTSAYAITAGAAMATGPASGLILYGSMGNLAYRAQSFVRAGYALHRCQGSSDRKPEEMS